MTVQQSAIAQPSTSQRFLPTPRCWVFSGIEFNEAENRLLISGRDQALPPLPSKLLLALLESAPNIVPKAVLLQQVWNRAPDLVSRNVLSNAVARLREAIGDADGRLIEGKPGIGYGLRGEVVCLPTAATSSADDAASGQAEADRFMSRVWLEALRGRNTVDHRVSLHEVLQSAIGRAETELAHSPAAIAAIHKALAGHCSLRGDCAGSARHFRRALELLSPTGEGPVPDFRLQMHFDLCRVLANSIALGDPVKALAEARRELTAANAALMRSPRALASTRLKAKYAAWFVAFFENNWSLAVALAEDVLHQADGMAELDASRRWEFLANHACTLMWAGREEAAVERIEHLLNQTEIPLTESDVVHMTARLFCGWVYAVTARPADAVRVLEPLHALMRDCGHGALSMGIQTTAWLAQSLDACGQPKRALELLQTAHSEAIAQGGATTELSLQVLAPLARSLASSGRRSEALSLLEAGVAPRLPRLAMPGQRYAVLALGCWIELLLDAGRVRETRPLWQRLKPADLRTAMLRPAEANAFIERCQAALDESRAIGGEQRFPRAHGAGAVVAG